VKRLDDNGNESVVATDLNRAEAERLAGSA
jgi:hypothetical protein